MPTAATASRAGTAAAGGVSSRSKATPAPAPAATKVRTTRTGTAATATTAAKPTAKALPSSASAATRKPASSSTLARTGPAPTAAARAQHSRLTSSDARPPPANGTAAKTTATPAPAEAEREEKDSNPHYKQAAALKLKAAEEHNEGSKAYSARNFPLAITHFEAAAELSTQVDAHLARYREDLPESAHAKFDADATRRQSNAVRRLDVLAACYRMTGQMDRYLTTTQQALRSIPAAQVDELSRAVGSSSLTNVFSLQEWSRTAVMVRDLLDLAFFDPAALSSPTLAQEDNRAQEPAPVNGDSVLQQLQIGASTESTAAQLCRAALLEHYVNSSLELNLHRETGPAAFSTVVSACLQTYIQSTYPIRYARVVMRRIEVDLLRPHSQPFGESLLQQISELLPLLEGDSREDDGLKRFSQQYMAGSYMLRTSIIQHCLVGDGSLDLLESVERATIILQKLADLEETPPNTSLPKSRPSLGATSRANHQAPVTPPRQIKSASTPTAKLTSIPTLNAPGSKDASSGEDGPTSHFDDPARLCAQLDAMCEMLAAFGHGLATLKLLRTLRRIHQLDRLRARLNRSDYYRCCASLASQYIALGQPARAQGILADAQKALHAQESSSLPAAKQLCPDAQVRCLLAETELYCALGEPQTASASYEQAVAIAEGIRPQKQRFRWQAGLEQYHLVERQAMASQVCATLRLAHRDLDGAIAASMLSCRQWYRLATLIGKLSNGPSPASSPRPSGEQLTPSSTTAIPGVEDPFGPEPAEKAHITVAQEEPSTAAEAKGGVPDEEKPAAKKPALQQSTRHLPSAALVSVFWKCGRSLVEALLQCSQLLLRRGSGRDAELYALEAVGTADALSAALLLARTQVQLAEVHFVLGRTKKGYNVLYSAHARLNEAWTPEACQSARIIGEAHLRAKVGKKATKSFQNGHSALEKLNALYSDVDTMAPSPAVRRMEAKIGSDGSVRKLGLPAGAKNSLLPDTQALLLIRQAQASLLEGDRAASASLLERVLGIPVTDGVDMQGKYVLGEIALQHALRSLVKHQVLNSLTDSAVSAPMISSSSKVVPASGVKSIVKALLSAHSSFSQVIHAGASTIDSPLLRDTAVSQVLALAILHTLEAGTKASAQRGDAASLSDFANSVTVMREYMVAISAKLAWSDFGAEEPKWLKVAHAHADTAVPKGMGLFAPKPSKLDAFWSKVYADGADKSLAADDVQLPPTWTVINISFVKSRNALLLTRQGGDHRPLAVHLAVDRMSRREGEDEHLSLDAAVKQMTALTNSINAGISGAKDVEGREAKMRWWEDRRRLDKELQELMTTIETTWLGAFKSIFVEPTRASDEDQAWLRDRLASVLKHACAPNSKAGIKIKLDRAIIECIARLRPGVAIDEDLEDLIHFMMDAMQVGGAPVAIDEVDVDDCVVEVRTALEEFWSRQSKAASEGARQPDSDHHLFLVLDKDACAFPWESLAILRDRPVSRIPSVRFLQDRIQMAPLFCAQAPDADTTGRFYELKDPKTFWLLNPSGDLKRTEARLTPWLSKQQRTSAWRGITGRIPIVDELPRALEENDVFTYFGHGGAEQYIRSARIRKLKRCAVTMLWGCSSAFLRDQGELDRAGTPLHYMLAGSPALVGNLWDMTDLELDRICETVFCKIGMMDLEDRGVKTLIQPSDEGQQQQQGPISLVRAVAEARRDCRLPYLSGGGCVTYGVPVYFSAA